MKSFTNFMKDQYLALQSILYHDQHLFKPICQGKYNMTEQQVAKYQMEQKLISEDTQKGYMQNDEQVALIKTYQNDPDSQEGRQALDKLVQNKMGLIYSKVNKFIALHPDLASGKDDMIQEASLALIKAIQKFDTNSKNIFNAYAITCIQGAIQNVFNPVRSKSIVAGKVDDVTGQTASMTSIDAPVSGSKGQWADKDMTVGDSIMDDQAVMPGEDEDPDAQKKALLNDWIKQLPERQQKAIRLYFPQSKEDQKTFEQIGKELGMSKMGAKKLIDRILSNMKKKAADYKGE